MGGKLGEEWGEVTGGSEKGWKDWKEGRELGVYYCIGELKLEVGRKGRKEKAGEAD